MDTNKEKFDFVCSLGGNCMAASQLQQRGLRMFSLPFDWLYMKQNEIVLYGLIECFKNNFTNFMIKKNMHFIPQEEFPNNGHPDRVFYQDTETKYYFLNHFDNELDVDNEFEKVKEKIERRINRFLNCINNSNKILFLLSHGFYIENQPYIDFYNFLKEFYPNKEIYIKAVQFDSKDEIKKFENVEIVRYKRVSNLYDYIKTNYEWNFLDNIEINRKLIKKEINREYGVKLLRFLKLKKGFAFEILPFLNSMISSKLYIFGVRLNLSIGKMKNE